MRHGKGSGASKQASNPGAGTGREAGLAAWLAGSKVAGFSLLAIYGAVTGYTLTWNYRQQLGHFLGSLDVPGWQPAVTSAGLQLEVTRFKGSIQQQRHCTTTPQNSPVRRQQQQAGIRAAVG